MGIFNAIFGSGTDTDTIKEMISNGAKIVDVRTPGEFQGGHVAGSRNIPLDKVSSKMNEIKKMGPVVLCCASGARSGQATSMLKSQGVDCVNGGSWLSVNALV